MLLLLSFGARGKQRIIRSAAAVVLLIVQILLAWTGSAVPYIFGGLHPINAFIILGLLGSTAYLEWKGRMDGHRDCGSGSGSGRVATRDRCAPTSRP